MSTYSAAIALQLNSASTSVPSSGGGISPGNVVYTAPAGRKIIIEITSFFNTLTGGAAVQLAFQKKSPNNGTWNEAFDFTMSGPTVANNETTCELGSSVLSETAAVAAQKIIESGRCASKLTVNPTLTSKTNLRLIMLPGDRLVTKAGQVADGSNFKISYHTEEYYST